jgi:hypothetical protein
MALISTRTIITSVSLLHITLAWFFLTNPQTINNQGLVWVIGESMGLPLARGLDVPSPALGFLSIVLAFVGINDLVSLSLPDDVGLLYYWTSQAPLRAVFSMSLIFYTFFFGPSSPFYQPPSPRGRLAHPSSHNPSYVPAGWGGDMLKNRVFFTFMFVEMISWFWVWITLREEKYAILRKAQAEHAKDD